MKTNPPTPPSTRKVDVKSDCENVQCKQVHELLDSFMAMFGRMGSPHQVSATKAAIVCDEIRKREDELTTLRTRLRGVEAERDRYKLALNRLLEGDHVGTPINRGCGAMSVIEDALSWTDAEAEQFIKEWDEGKHQLSPEDEKALEASKAKLFERIRRDAFLNPTNNQQKGEK